MLDKYICEYGKRFYGLCITLCHNGYDADDLYQETWLKACSSLDKYDRLKPFEPWITTICVNIFRDVLRRRKRNPVFDKFTSSQEKEAIIDSVVSVQNNDFSCLYSAVDKLPDKLRTTVILFYFHDLSELNTALTLKIPVGTVKSRLHKAKKLLKEELGSESAF